MQYPVVEHFKTFQGEGCHLGRAIYLIRLFGCPVACPWCDSANTWHPDFIPPKIPRLSPQSLAQAALASQVNTVMITGGEPTIHPLAPLTSALKALGIATHLETSGAFPLSGDWDWITLSPKWNKTPLKTNVAAASELKWIIDEIKAPQKWQQFFKHWPLKNKSIWLHPEYSIRHKTAILNTITSWVTQHGDPYRVGWQIHRLYKADDFLRPPSQNIGQAEGLIAPPKPPTLSHPTPAQD